MFFILIVILSGERGFRRRGEKPEGSPPSIRPKIGWKGD